LQLGFNEAEKIIGPVSLEP